MSQESKMVKVGVGVLICCDDEYLMIRRNHKDHGYGTWAPPGGHLDFGEAPDEAAIREAKEEIGLVLSDPEFFAFTNDIFTENGRQYITIFFKFSISSKLPLTIDSNEISEVKWCRREDFPQPLFLSMANLVSGKGFGKKL